jgi:hypothetical protein
MNATSQNTITDQERRRWRTTGRLAQRGRLDQGMVDQLTAWVDTLSEWATTPNGPGLHHWEQTDNGPVLARSEYFADAHPELGAFLRGPLLGETLAALLGEPAVLFKEKVNYKHPGGGGFAPHQDATAYRFVDHHLSVMVPLDPATIASGCLWFAAENEPRILSHTEGRIAPEIVESLDWEPVEAVPGDLVFFDSFAPHRSDTNTTDSARRILYLTYNAASAGDLRAAYYADKVAEFNREGDAFAPTDHAPGQARISINNDFLGRPVDADFDPTRR